MPRENLHHWLLDENARDQFVVRHNDETELWWNDPGKPDQVRSYVLGQIIEQTLPKQMLAGWGMGGQRSCSGSRDSCWGGSRTVHTLPAPCSQRPDYSKQNWPEHSRPATHPCTHRCTPCPPPFPRCSQRPDYSKKNWSEHYVAWSPRGSYLATFHRLGIQVQNYSNRLLADYYYILYYCT